MRFLSDSVIPIFEEPAFQFRQLVKHLNCVSRNNATAAHCTRFRRRLERREINFVVLAKLTLKVIEFQATCITIIVPSVARIIGHAKVVYNDCRIRERPLDDLKLVFQGKILFPMRVEIKQRSFADVCTGKTR